MERPLIITLDGPMGSGKTTLGRALAERLNLPFLSTGLLYRAVAYLMEKERLPLEETRILKALEEHPLSLVLKGREYEVALGSSPLTPELLRSEALGELASEASRLKGVRAYLLPIQRGAVRKEGLVAEGRDLGTVVFPEATLKLYLTADPEVRFKRRAQELGVPWQSLKKESQRDERDTTRSVAPLTIPPSARILDTTHSSTDELVRVVLQYLDSLTSQT